MSFDDGVHFDMPDNVQNHRVTASDVDFRLRPADNSGAFFC
jgi:hypothetical protein